MALDLDEKPGKYDSGADDKFNPLNRLKPDSSGSHDDVPYDKAKSKKMDEGLNKILNGEKNPEGGNTSAVNSAEKGISSAADTASKLGRGFNPTPVGKAAQLKDFTLKALGGEKAKRNSGIGAAVATIGGTMLMIFAIWAPTSVTEYLRNLGLEKANELQTSKSIRYRRSRLNKMGDLFSRDGRRAGRIQAEMSARGYDFEFNDPLDSNRVTGMRHPASRDFVRGDAMGELTEDYLNRKPFATTRWKTKVSKSLNARFSIPETSVTRARANQLDDPELEINRRNSQAIFTGNDDVLDGDVRVKNTEDLPDDTPDDVVRANDELADLNGEFGPHKEAALQNGTPTRQVEAPVTEVIDDIDAPRTQEAVDAFENASKKGLIGSFAAFANSFDIADKICTVKNRLRAAVFAARVVRAVGLQRLATIAILLPGDATRVATGHSPQLHNELARRFTTPDANGQSLGGSVMANYLATGAFNPAANFDQKSGFAMDGVLTGVPFAIQSATNRIPGMSANQCGLLWQNPAAQITAGGIEVVAAIFTGGSSKAVTKGAQEGVELGVKQIIRRIINRNIVRSLGKTVAIEFSFAAILGFTQLYSEKLLSFALSGQELGGDLTNKGLAGTMKYHEQRNKAEGFVPRTEEQYNQAQQEFYAYKHEQIKNQGIFERIFDVNNTDSLAFRHYLHKPFNGQQGFEMASNFASKLPITAFTTPLSATKTIANLFIPSVYAQDDGSDLQTYEVYVTQNDSGNKRLVTGPEGSLLTDLVDFGFDPYENEDWLIENGHIQIAGGEPTSGEFKEYMEQCALAVDTISSIEAGHDCLAEERLTQRFVTQLQHQGFLDGLDGEFFDEELDENPTNSSGGSGTTSQGLVGLDGPIIPCEGDPRDEAAFRGPGQNTIDWDSIPASGTFPLKDSSGADQFVYMRDACAGTTDVRTVVIGSSIHGSENGGQRVSFELLFNADLPDDVRIVAIPRVNSKAAIESSSRKNSAGVNLNRNFDYGWGTRNGNGDPSSGDYWGPSAASEPETQNVQEFLKAVGQTNLFISYHDCINWVAPSGPNSAQSRPIAQAYSTVVTTKEGFQSAGSCNGRSNNWYMLNNNQGQGFMEGWYANETDTRALLVEFNNTESAGYFKAHADTVVELLETNVID